jgi:GntR family transcriptional regulator, transcriptional repressor for pyruvate dehydrogenase complex
VTAEPSPISGVWAQDSDGLDRRTLADQVADAILNDIIDQRLTPGTPLPSERLLAERFEVNRLVIREATRTLVAREFLDSGQGRPARVRLPSGSTLAQVLRFHLLLDEVAPEDVLRARHLIETELAADAARSIRRSEGDVTRMAEALAAMEASVDDAEPFVQSDLAFHREIAELSQNRLFALLLAGLQNLLLEVRRLSYASSHRKGEGQLRAIEHHRRILAAIADGDPEGARDAMRAHIEQTADDVRNLPDDRASDE